MGIFSNRASQSELIASEIRSNTAESNARRLKNEADHALDRAGAMGMAGVTAAALLNKRARDLLFQMAVKDAKIRTTIKRLKAAYPGDEVKIDELVMQVGTEYDDDKEWLKGKREYTDSLNLFSDPEAPPPPPSTP